MMKEISGRPLAQRLWWIAAAPSVWAMHFLTCYITTAIWCEKYSGAATLMKLWSLVGGYTAIAIMLIVAVGVTSYRNFRLGDPPLPYDFDDPNKRTPFLNFTAFLLAVLSLVATLFTALVFVMIRSCD